MMSVDLSENDTRRYLYEFGDRLHVACINSPCNVTVSGDEDAIDLLKAQLDADEVAAQKLRTGVAYHTPHMEEIAAEYAECLQGLRRGMTHSPRRITMFSSVTGKAIQNLDMLCTAEYWVSNMVQPVRYAAAVKGVISSHGTRKLGTPRQDTIHDLVEIGPHSTLRGPTRSILDNTNPRTDIRYTFVLSRKRPAPETLLELCGHLWSLGYPVTLEKVNQVNAYRLSQGQALVDLPAYPFNHSRRYWHESKLSSHSRLRQHPRHELLGTPVPDWNSLEPRWRKFFNISETPWIEDHKVNGRRIYPATGMVVMAIEGAKQLADPTRVITGFAIKDATFSHPIAVDNSERVEVQLFMRPHSSVTKKYSENYEYWICIRNGDEWQENCRGRLQVQYERSRDELDSVEKDGARTAIYTQRYAQALAACTHTVKTESMYQQFQSNGLQYGPAFQTMSELAWDGTTTSIGKLKTFEWSPQQSQHGRQSHVVHPTTLDAAGQLMWVALTQGATKKIVNGAAVTRIQSAWISSSGLAYPETTSINACSTSCLKGLRGTDSSMFALDHKGDLKMVINHMETTAVSGNEVNAGRPDPRRICFGMIWKPDGDLMSPDEMVSYCRTNDPDVADPISFYHDLGRVLYHYVEKALESIQDMGITSLKPHIQKYVAWLRTQASKYTPEQDSNVQIDWDSRARDIKELESVASRLEVANAEGKFLVTVGRSLESIIRGTSDPLEIMFRDGLVDAHYHEICDKTSCCRQLRSFLDVLAHKNPGLKIIEVGAGTGSITRHILEPLQLRGDVGNDGHRFSQYDYTDISEAFFEHARERFNSTKAKMNYKILNIEKDPAGQGYTEGGYDLVVAAWVLHATRDLGATVRNVRKLLKTGGRLVLLEITKPNILRNGLAFGTLPGWWLSTEKSREWSPCISHEQWNHILTSQGFSGVDLLLRDYQSEECHENSIMIATALGESCTVSPQKKLTIIVDTESSAQATVADRLCHLRGVSRAGSCNVVSVRELAAVTWSKDATVVLLPELESPFLYSLGEQGFRQLQEMLRRVQNIVWVTSNNKASPKSPQLCMVTGLARVLCTENANLSFVTMALEDHGNADLWAKRIADVLDSLDSNANGACEMEYVESNGMMMINRVVEARPLSQEVHAKSNSTVTLGEFGKGPPLALAVSNPGFLDSLQFTEDFRHYAKLGQDDIEIEVLSIGVNFRDLLVVLGRYTANTVGCECAGVVTQVGSNCTTVCPGDRVCAAIVGCVYTYARCHYQLAVKIPDRLSFAQAASLPITGVTAYHSLINVANLRREDSILIHSGAGGTGQMAIQLAKSIGSEVFVTVSSKEKQLLLMETYGIPSDHIFYSRDSSFAQDIMRMTQDRGIDVILNSLSGESLIASWECMAPFGRFVELGKADVESNSKLPMSFFAKNVSFSAVAVDYICANRPDLVRKSLVAILDMIKDGRIEIASPLQEFSIADMEKALRFMQSGKNMGKIVLNINPNDIVPVSSFFLSFLP